MNKNTGIQSAITNGTPVPPPQVRTTPLDGGPAEQQKTDERCAVASSSSDDDDDFCSGGPNDGSEDLPVRLGAARSLALIAGSRPLSGNVNESPPAAAST